MPDFGISEASLALGAIGAGTSAIGALTQGSATAANARYQSQVAANNAIIAQQNAAYAAAAGVQRATNVGMAGAARLGAIKTAQAASGIDVNTGSAADVQRSAREVGQLNTLTEENNALLQAYGYRAAATSATAESGLLSAEAAQAPTGAALSAIGGLAGSAAGFLPGGLIGGASALGYKWSGIGVGGFQDFSGGVAGPGA